MTIREVFALMAVRGTSLPPQTSPPDVICDNRTIRAAPDMVKLGKSYGGVPWNPTEMRAWTALANGASLDDPCPPDPSH